MLAECSQVYSCALQGPLPMDHERQALRRLATLYKRAGMRQEAVELWRMMLDDENDPPLEPYVELAKHYEWIEPDYQRASAYTERAIAQAIRGRPGPQRQNALSDLQHRLDRLQRKIRGVTHVDDAVIPPDDRDVTDDA